MNRHTDKWILIESPDIDTNKYGLLIFDIVQMQFNTMGTVKPF